MATGVTANITIDDVAVSSTHTEPTEARPICYGPISVHVDNGEATGDIREKLCTLTVRVKGNSLLNTITIGAKLKLELVIDGAATMFDGMVYETAHRAVHGDLLDITLTGKDDQTKLKLFGSSPSNRRLNPTWTGLQDPPGQLWSLDQGGDIRLEDTSVLDFRVTSAAGNAWNDHTDPLDHWAYSYSGDGQNIGASTADEMFDQLEWVSKAALLRYAMESGVGCFQAARYYGSEPYEIPAKYVEFDQEFKAELFTRPNYQDMSTSYETRKPLPGNGPDDPHVYPQNFDEIDRFGEIRESYELGDVWQLHQTNERFDYPVSWGDRKRFSSPHYFVKPWYQVEDAPILLHRMIDDDTIGPAVVTDLLENTFDITRRLGADPFIPSMLITGADTPIPRLNLSGVIEVADLTVTPRKQLPPRLDLIVSLGPGDGYPAPFKHAPTPARWSDATWAWKDARAPWNWKS